MEKNNGEEEGKINKSEEIILAKKENRRFEVKSGDFSAVYFEHPDPNGRYDIVLRKQTTSLGVNSIYLKSILELNTLLEMLKIIKGDLE